MKHINIPIFIPHLGCPNQCIFCNQRHISGSESFSEETVKNKFGALYNAFKFGAPPHAGAAPGIDRMIMLLLGETNIREVIAFPKNSKARDLLMQAPNYVTEEQLRDVHIKIDVKDKKKED